MKTPAWVRKYRRETRGHVKWQRPRKIKRKRDIFDYLGWFIVVMIALLMLPAIIDFLVDYVVIP